MADQVLRMEARSQPISASCHLVQHILGEIRPKNAVPRPGLPAVEVLADDVDAARAAMDAELARPRRGAHPCRAVDFILAGPPPHDGPYAWKKEAVDDWAKAALAWVRAYCPDAPVAAAAVHWDERSPHMHLLLAPIVREGGKVRLGIKAIRQRLASGVEAPRRKRGQHRDELSAVQDAYHEHVARRFGLRRGNTQSTARHVKVDALEGAQRRLHDLRGSVEHYDRAMDSVLEQRRDLNDAVAELRHEQARLRGSREVDEREAGLAQVRRETAERAAREAEEERKRAEGFSRRLVVGRQARKGKARREELEQRVEELRQARDALDGEASALRTRVNGLEVRAMSAEARNAAADAALAAANGTMRERERLRTRNAELEGRLEAIEEGETKLQAREATAATREAALEDRESRVVASEGEARTKAEGIVAEARGEAARVKEGAEAHRQEQARRAEETQSAREKEAERLEALRTETASAQQRLQTARQHETSARNALTQLRAAIGAAERQRKEDQSRGNLLSWHGRALRERNAELKRDNARLEEQVRGEDVRRRQAELGDWAAEVERGIRQAQALWEEEREKTAQEKKRKEKARAQRLEVEAARDQARRDLEEAERLAEEARQDRARGSKRTREGKALRERLDALETECHSLEAQLESKETEISGLRGQIRERDARLAALDAVKDERDRLRREAARQESRLDEHARQAYRKGVREAAGAGAALVSAYGRTVVEFARRRGRSTASPSGLTAPLETVRAFLDRARELEALPAKEAETLRQKLERGVSLQPGPAAELASEGEAQSAPSQAPSQRSQGMSMG